MANEVKVKYIPEVTYQASAAITADALSAGTQTANDNTANGYDSIDMYIDVTAAPATAATCELWEENSTDGQNWATSEYALTVAVPTSVGRHHLGEVSLAAHSRYAIKAIDYGFTASLIGVPKIPEIQ